MKIKTLSSACDASKLTYAVIDGYLTKRGSSFRSLMRSHKFFDSYEGERLWSDLWKICRNNLGWGMFGAHSTLNDTLFRRTCYLIQDTYNNEN